MRSEHSEGERDHPFAEGERALSRNPMIAVIERAEIEIFFCRTAHFLLDDRRLFVWMISEA